MENSESLTSCICIKPNMLGVVTTVAFPTARISKCIAFTTTSNQTAIRVLWLVCIYLDLRSFSSEFFGNEDKSFNLRDIRVVLSSFHLNFQPHRLFSLSSSVPPFLSFLSFLYLLLEFYSPLFLLPCLLDLTAQPLHTVYLFTSFWSRPHQALQPRLKNQPCTIPWKRHSTFMTFQFHTAV